MAAVAAPRKQDLLGSIRKIASALEGGVGARCASAPENPTVTRKGLADCFHRSEHMIGCLTGADSGLEFGHIFVVVGLVRFRQFRPIGLTATKPLNRLYEVL